MAGFIKRRSVIILTLLGLACPFIGMALIDFYYFSSLIGWIAGFICFVFAYIIVVRRPETETGA
ncbi:hypothetical protein J9317_07480 [Metabacillus sp. KIGAM252]|uniref:Uncharacterized protein n=1 Tax=Metabacillus flavus TaxID=2823519 RepID=A0ABS5LCY8_9BACI|nr:hypothetical protein [Metabacillus flavus]MBS2968597.1 hypothetical protein [Metabacillus flavus]